MPILRIVVVDAPETFGEHGPIALRLPSKDGFIEGTRTGADLHFEVPYEVKADRSGSAQPVGEFVQRQPDGRRFVYLTWLHHQHGFPTQFRRLKVHFDRVAEGSTEIRVAGHDKKGGPACASAIVIGVPPG